MATFFIIFCIVFPMVLFSSGYINKVRVFRKVDNYLTTIIPEYCTYSFTRKSIHDTGISYKIDVRVSINDKFATAKDIIESGYKNKYSNLIHDYVVVTITTDLAGDFSYSNFDEKIMSINRRFKKSFIKSCERDKKLENLGI